MRSIKVFITGFCFLCMGLLPGCFGNNKPAQPIEYYHLSYDTPDLKPNVKPDVKPGVRNDTPLPIVLSLLKFKSSPPYNTTRIIFSKSKFSQNKYYYHQWISFPDEMITHLLARDLIASGIAQAVFVSNEPLASHQLKGSVEEFYEQDLDDQWNAVLSITVTLINRTAKDDSDSICFQKNYKKTYPCNQKNPKGLAQAMSMAMAEISELVVSDIYLSIQ